MVAPQPEAPRFAEKTPRSGQNREFWVVCRDADYLVFPSLFPPRSLQKIASAPGRSALRQNPTRGRITDARQTTDARRSTDAWPFRSETAAAHRQSIRRLSEK